jgi:osmotically-inducible protein OsmY
MDPLVWDGPVSVDVADGVVKLRGVVGTAAARSHAHMAARVVGVKHVDTTELLIAPRTRKVKLPPHPEVVYADTTIARAVRDALLLDPRTTSYAIRVSVEEGVVVLTGDVESVDTKRAAELDARNTVGVWRVRNDIRVRPVDIPTDAQLEGLVESALQQDAVLERHHIIPTARNGKVFLHGNVDTYYERDRATAVVGRLPGVAAMNNNLEVRSTWVWRTDSSIQTRIVDELRKSALVDESDITVEVVEGTAVLSGPVGTYREMNAVVENAFEGGARSVENRLEGRGAPGGHPTYTIEEYYRYNMPMTWQY